jgi:hypothetical protein
MICLYTIIVCRDKIDTEIIHQSVTPTARFSQPILSSRGAHELELYVSDEIVAKLVSSA